MTAVLNVRRLVATGINRSGSAEGLALFFAEIHRDALLLQARSRLQTTSGLAQRGIVQRDFLTRALRRRLARSGVPRYNVPRENVPDFYADVLARGMAFFDRPFAPTGPLGIENPAHGVNVHAFQISYIQPAVEAANVPVSDFLMWLSSSPMRRTIWDVIFDPLNDSIFQPEILTPAIRQALGDATLWR